MVSASWPSWAPKIDLDLVAAGGALLDELAEILHGLDGRIAVRMGVGRAQHRLGAGAADGQGGGEQRGARDLG